MSAVEPVSCYSAAVANGNRWYVFSTFPKFQKLEAVYGLGMFCLWGFLEGERRGLAPMSCITAVAIQSR